MIPEVRLPPHPSWSPLQSPIWHPEILGSTSREAEDLSSVTETGDNDSSRPASTSKEETTVASPKEGLMAESPESFIFSHFL